MKYSLFIVGLLIGCSTLLYGQDNILVRSRHIAGDAEKSREILHRSALYTNVEFVDINLDKILEYKDFLLQFDERNIPIRKERIDVRGINNYVFVGSNNEGTRILISVLGNDIQGVIETNEEVFTIETFGSRLYALITVDHSLLREGCGNLHEKAGHSGSKLVNANDFSYDNGADGGIETSPILSAALMYDCKIRVLVLYTQNAQIPVSNIKNTILTAVELTNQSFINSQINYQIELVYAGQTNYTEANFDLDLERFMNSGDGYMDEVHTLRNKYSADICVLLINDSEYCGLAADIGATSNKAFCAVSTIGTCATTNYSFGHEIGHLLGCRHDTYVDPNTTPFAYGHGYVNPARSWRTIMAYSNACGACPRLLYWSNPNISCNGEPAGTISTNNNARVWNERSNSVMEFRQPATNVTFTSSDMPDTKYADVIAKQNITTSGTVNTNSGNTLNMRAGNSISLQPGFSVQSGAELSVDIESVDDCPNCAIVSTGKVIVQSVTEVFRDMTEPPINAKPCFTYKVCSTPSADDINITYSLNEDLPLSIELMNFSGQEIMTILPMQKLQAGNYTLQFPLSDLSAGTYFLSFSSENQTRVEKIIINQ